MSKKVLPLVAIAVVAAASLAGGYFESLRTARAITSEADGSEALKQTYEEALTTVRDNYASQADLEDLGKSTIQGMLHQLDPHSSFFTKKEFDELQTEQKSRIFGIGVTIVRRYNRVYIMSAIPGTPAHRAGLRYGDAIVGLDGQNVEEWRSEQVMHRVRGEKGEEVEITVERVGAPNPITVKIRRDEVRLPSVPVSFMMSQPGTGYIALSTFSSKTEEELSASIKKLKQEGMKQLILDFRGNPGGLLDQAIEVAQKFLQDGQKILEVRGRESRFLDRTFEVSDNNDPETMPMVILINRHTASASEVVAGALQDHDRALIVGENSFGKGLVQSVTRVWGGAGLTLTTARYYTPTGRSIQRDYSKVSFYDYYLNRDEPLGGGAKGDALHTDLGRAVYGGGGITPDIEIKSPESGPVRSRLFLAVFDFARQLVAGQTAGLREYRVGDTQYKTQLGLDDIERYPVNEKVIAAFRQHIGTRPQFNVTDEQFNTNANIIKTWLRREIMTAAYGPEAGQQVYLSDDVQVRKAIESLPEARMLADNARRARSDRQ
ncbi:MAG TPA: S41 family peptidase [Blastocatellia bacterium]|nr:S41 family peptidase [Blastocatellia bacterium]